MKKAALTVASALQQSDVTNCPLCKKRNKKQQKKNHTQKIKEYSNHACVNVNIAFYLCDLLVRVDSQMRRLLRDSDELIYKLKTNKKKFLVAAQ